MKKIYIGIDPGFSGGIVRIGITDNNQATILDKMPMPLQSASGKKLLDLHGIHRIFEGWIENSPANTEFIIEEVGSMPKQGLSSTFRCGYFAGALEGIISTFAVPVTFVGSQAWMKVVFKDIPKTSEVPSRIFCQRRYPYESFLATERSKIAHDGMTDACAIAHYLYLK